MPERQPSERPPATAHGFQNVDGYERTMGRWSRRLAPLLIDFGGLADGDRVLDVGCGTGSLTFALTSRGGIASVTGIDLAEPLVAFARAKNRDPRITFELGDACALPHPDATFDRAFSMLVLHFIPEAANAVAEMRRVVRPGGWVTAAVWDNYGGQLFTRILWDIAGVLDPDVRRPYFRPLNGPGEMAAAWRASGMIDVTETNLLIRMEYEDFEDYWMTFTIGEGAHGVYVRGLSNERRDLLKQHVRAAYLGNRSDDPRSMTAVAWACRGGVPE